MIGGRDHLGRITETGRRRHFSNPTALIILIVSRGKSFRYRVCINVLPVVGFDWNSLRELMRVEGLMRFVLRVGFSLE